MSFKRTVINDPVVHFSDDNPDSRSKCEQHHITDINEIMAIKPNAAQRDQLATEIDQAQDFVNMANALPEEEFALTYTKAREIEYKFAQKVPAEIRKQFGNSALEFVKAFQDPKQNEKFYELGLKQRPVAKPTEEQLAAAELETKANEWYRKKIIEDYKATQ